METKNSLDFAQCVYKKQKIYDNTPDDVQLEKYCPLDNGRHDYTPISTGYWSAR